MAMKKHMISVPIEMGKAWKMNVRKDCQKLPETIRVILSEYLRR